nr:MAG TPA: hypothetical protein [Herelleviridae sp.]
MTNLDYWWKILHNNDIHASNKVSTFEQAICVNFLQIPDTNTLAMTLTVMKNKTKKNSLSPTSFAKLMDCIEDGLNQAQNELPEWVTMENEHFINLKYDLKTTWYIELCCHRVFFIPQESLFSTIENIFNKDHMDTLKESGIEEVSVVVNTDDYDFNAKFY